MSLNRGVCAVFSGIVLLVASYGGIIIYFSWPITLGNVDKAGVFGDSFGVLTSLFSGLAFAGIVFTILLQKEDLGIQRNELRLTRMELEKQVNAIKHQNFESTFFQMLRLHNEIVQGIDLRSQGDVTTTGRDCFVVFYRRIEALYGIKKRENLGLSEQELIETAYAEFWEQNRNDLGHYFRYLYTIFKFLKKSSINDKRLYSNIVRAQLSDQELLTLFYNCLYIFGVEKFKPLVEEFAIFDNLPRQRLLALGHLELYRPAAFDSSLGNPDGEIVLEDTSAE